MMLISLEIQANIDYNKYLRKWGEGNGVPISETVPKLMFDAGELGVTAQIETDENFPSSTLRRQCHRADCLL